MTPPETRAVPITAAEATMIHDSAMKEMQEYFLTAICTPQPLRRIMLTGVSDCTRLAMKMRAAWPDLDWDNN